jgi:UDPglucose 6-dehydrogenase
MQPDGSCNLDIVSSVVLRLNQLSKDVDKRVVVIKSTVVPGTTNRLNKKCDRLHVCFNPEFLTERNSVEDFKNQDRIIIGGPRGGTNVLKHMYAIAYPDVPVTKTSSTIAELVKYTTNCFLATKVALANELEQICEALDVDYDKTIEYAIKDERLGQSHWSVPGPDGKKGFGLTCFPKDLNALIALAKSLDVKPTVMEAVWQKNLEVRPERDWEKLKGRAVSS